MKVEYQIIKKRDNFCIDENQFICLLETNNNYKINKVKKIIKYKNIDIKYEVKTVLNSNNEEIIFIICFLIDDEKKLEDFEKFDKSFIDFVKRFNDNVHLNRLWDDISKKYAEEMYPKIFYIENLLRKIIYYFMGKNVGNNWTVECFPRDVESSIRNVKNKNKSENNENILYYADFIQLSFFLFNKYPKEEISQNSIIEKLREKDSNINELINKYEFKSNWDRYFEPVVNKEDLENNLNELYNYRNLVAHNRLIREKDRNRSNELITKIEKVFNECLTKIDDIKVPEEDKEKFENMSSKILSPITNNIDELGCISSIDSMRGIFGFDSGIVSSLDSVKNLSALSSASDCIKRISGFDSGIVSSLDSVKKDK